ncbi:MAG TPA: ABC transporter ATP-binding protein [Miltoncostaeaceae bacterium]|nr:ABC transporter ATP-binding protein [Miltoncostaeaceae bacterium]
MPSSVITVSEAPPVSPPTSSDVIVQGIGLTRRYGAGDAAVDALRGVSIAVERGELVAVMGPSGSGKSTLMHVLAGLDRPTAGTVKIAGTDITRMGDTELTKLRRDHIGFIFQFFNLLPMLSAKENIVLPLRIAGRKPDKQWMRELVATVGLADRLDHRPAQLSGGQQQRVAIARAMVARPSVMFADEPTGNLDSSIGGEILELLRGSVERFGQTTVMVTHDPRAAAIADRVLFIADGQVVKALGPSSPRDVIVAMEEVSSR